MTGNKTLSTSQHRNDLTFACCQGLLLAIIVVCGGIWSVSENRRLLAPAFSECPRTVRPLFDYPLVVSDSQLASVLKQSHPRFTQQPTKVNFIDHALRMWGSEAEFNDGSLSGAQLLKLLTDHNTFTRTWGPGVPALLRRSEHGIMVTTQEGQSSVSHEDHLLGTLAEIGIPLSQKLQSGSGQGTVQELLNNAVRSFRVNQREYEWTVLSAAYYAIDGRPWFTREGQAVDFNTLARRLMRQRQPLGVCYGQHRLYTLTMLLRIDEQMRCENAAVPMLTPETRQQVEEYLLNMTCRFYATQAAAGYWDGNWADASQPVSDPETDVLSRRLLATGHALEWWAMVPAELHPPRETIVRASQWLARTIIEMEPVQVERNYTFLTHAARALALWRGGSPAELEIKLQQSVSAAVESEPTNSSVKTNKSLVCKG
jgi:hypothetical protein